MSENAFASTPFADRVLLNEPLAKHTTLGVGGPAQYFFTATATADIVAITNVARERHIAVTLIGGGSNILVNDEGIKGVVIQNRSSSWEILPTENIPRDFVISADSRWRVVNEKIDIASYDDSKYPTVMVRVDSGCLVQRLMFELVDVGVTGLEWFSGIPATVGGAVYMNMHGAHAYFGDCIVRARLLDEQVNVREVDRAYFQFAYDWSVLHDTNEIVLDVVMVLRRGPVEQSKVIMQEWMRHKNKTQPKKSCGSVFGNISAEDQARLNLPTASAGYIIDKVLDLNGKQIGGARIHDTNGNFMVNTGTARAEDFAILIAYVKEQARNKLGLDLHEEVHYIGYDN